MTLILADIRKEYDIIAAKNRDEAEEWYKRKCSDLEEKSRSNQEELEKVNTEISEYRNGSVSQNWDTNFKILTEISDREKENKCRGWKWNLKVYADQMNISSAIFK